MAIGQRLVRPLFELYLRRCWHNGKIAVTHQVLRALSLEEVRSPHGPILSADPQDFTSALAISGAYGRDISDHIAGLPPDASFIDIGASYGLFTLLAAQQLSQGQVLAFEPNPNVFAHLLRGLRLNGVDNVSAVNSAIGPANGLSNLQFDATHSGMGRLAPGAHADGIDVSVIDPVDHPLFDSLRKEVGIHIKIDTEGYEHEIISLLRKAPWFDRVRSIIVEIDDDYLRTFGSSAQSVYELLQAEGFSPRRGLGATPHYDEIFSRLP